MYAFTHDTRCVSVLSVEVAVMTAATMRVVMVFLSVALNSCLGPPNITTCGKKGAAQVDETDVADFTCTAMTQNAMLWFVEPGGNTTADTFISCGVSPGSCTGSTDVYSVSRPDNNTIVLNVTGNYRDNIAGTLSCGVFNGFVLDYDVCNIRVVYTSYNVTCTVYVADNWTVTGRCDVDKIFSSNGHYRCVWVYMTLSGTLATSIGQNSTLTPYTDITGQQYQRMMCSFTGQPLPSEDGQHNYTLYIDPRKTDQSHHNVIQIQSPQGPPVLHKCPSVITEGDDVTCTCQASQAMPFALVTWTSDAIPESNTSSLSVYNVSRSQDGHSYTCSQYWGGYDVMHMKETNYTINVAWPREVTQESTFGAAAPPPTTTTTVQARSPDNDDSSDGKLAAIVSGVAAVIIIGLIIVIVVLVLLRKGKCGPLYAKTTPGTQVDEHAYTDLDHCHPVEPSAQNVHHFNTNSGPSVASTQHAVPVELCVTMATGHHPVTCERSYEITGGCHDQDDSGDIYETLDDVTHPPSNEQDNSHEQIYKNTT